MLEENRGSVYQIPLKTPLTNVEYVALMMNLTNRDVHQENRQPETEHIN